MDREITVPHIEQPTRLDKFLVQELGSGWSRTFIQQAIKNNAIKVNEKKVTVHHFLKEGDVIMVGVITPEVRTELEPQAKVPWKLIKETNDFLIIEKPTGVIVHPAPGINEPTLIEGLLSKYPELKDVGDDPMRPGIVHRLDRDVSGLMVVARNQNMFDYLKRLFKEREITKKYFALVVGHLNQPDGVINFPLARSRNKHGKMAARAKSDSDTREAVTKFELIKLYQPASLLKIEIETGRTHQIRAHLAALGYPIVGDNLYRPKKLNFKATPERLFLHATELSFVDQNGENQTFTSPLPQELNDFLNKLS
jgi:23S rRNA pseudouridine1911/1915/1917 synthase